MTMAEYWTRDGDVVRCDLCPHHCRLRDGQTGRCHVRTARDGQLIAAAYGCASSAHLDPIEKKPLYHFHPGSQIFSIGGWGCNFACDFCQNWSISQSFETADAPVTPATILAAAQRSDAGQVAYTYNEPLVNFEFVRDCSRLMRDQGIRNVLVTNGFGEAAPAAELLALTDAVNLDIKSMTDGFYRRRCGGRLDPVLRFARLTRTAGCHLEITHLLVPDPAAGDPADQPAQLAEWIATELGPDVPLHISAYHPQYRSKTPATSTDQLLEAHAAAAARLRFVYLGNVRSATGRDTHCPRCGQIWIRRGDGYGNVAVTGIRDAHCTGCDASAAVRL